MSSRTDIGIQFTKNTILSERARASIATSMKMPQAIIGLCVFEPVLIVLITSLIRTKLQFNFTGAPSQITSVLRACRRALNGYLNEIAVAANTFTPANARPQIAYRRPFHTHTHTVAYDFSQQRLSITCNPKLVNHTNID